MNTITKYEHVDAWLDAPTTDERELPAKMWLEKFRAPAGCKDDAWLKAHILQCEFHGRVYVVVGCSRMGDVWLATPPPDLVEIPEGYELRVSIDDCSDWSMRLRSGDNIDLDGPWRLCKAYGILGHFVPTIVDCCNHPLFLAHTAVGVLERIVKDHNDALVPFVSPYASELDTGDDEDEIPADACDHDDPLTDRRIANAEGWGLFDIGAGLHEIQRDDELDVFELDVEAVRFVTTRAKTSPYHAKALAIHAAESGQIPLFDACADLVEKAAPLLLKTLVDVSNDAICMQGFHEQFRHQIRDAIKQATIQPK